MTISQELSDLGSAIAEELVQVRDPKLTEQIDALDAACDAAARAWSGSNIGYHAAVYNAGLEPKPAGMIFSPEWGLMDRWPTHQPHPGWHAMDHHEVITELLRRAGITDLDAIEETFSRSRDKLYTLREQAVSMLSAGVAKKKDEFVSRQLKHIEDIHVASPHEVARGLLPRNPWSRDSTAMSQGIALAPHQQLEAVVLSGRNTISELENLERAVRLSATHLKRMEPMDRADKDRGKNVVIGHGSSTAWRDLKDFVKDRLRLSHDEFNRVPIAGLPNTMRLTQMLDDAAIAFVVLTGEDEHVDGSVRARQNVIHEAGLFQGRLGFTKAIVMLEEGCEEFTNIQGLGQIRFPKGNIVAVFEEVRRVLEREGVIAT